MKKINVYRYTGVNGSITSEVFLPDVYALHLIKLIADNNKKITNGEKIVSSIIVPKIEENNWYEIEA